MKYLILNKENVIFHISDTIGYQSNGNPLVDNATLAIAAILVKEVVEIDETQVTIPEDYVDGKYMYVDGAIVANPNYKEPVKPMDTVAEIKGLKESTASLETQMTDAQMAIVESYESSENQITDLQLAITELYELVLSL